MRAIMREADANQKKRKEKDYIDTAKRERGNKKKTPHKKERTREQTEERQGF